MGVKHLKKFLFEQCNENGVKSFLNMKTFLNSEKNRYLIQNNAKFTYILGIDVALYAAKYRRIFKCIEYGFIKQILLTLSENIIPLYVLDGTMPYQKKQMMDFRKQSVLNNRINLEKFINQSCNYNSNIINNVSNLSADKLFNHINKIYNKNYSSVYLYDSTDKSDEYNTCISIAKRSLHINKKEISDLINFFNLLKIPYIIADTEADDMMGTLYRNGIINACLSDDMDMLPKGCDNLIQISYNNVVQYYLPDILKNLNLSRNQFIDMCILMGTDYYTTFLPKIKPSDLYTFFIQHPDENDLIEEFVKYYKELDPRIEEHLNNYKYTRIFYRTNNNIEPPKLFKIIPIKMNKILSYFDSIGISIDNDSKQKMSKLLARANRFINTI